MSSADKCMEVVQKIEGISTSLVLKAARRFENVEVRNVFLGLNDANRVAWVWELANDCLFLGSMSDSDDEIESGLVQQNDDDGSEDEMLGYFLFNVAAPLISNQPKIRIPQNTSRLSGEDWLLELLNGADTRFYNALRLTKPCFRALVDEFKTRGLLFNSQRAHVSVEEKVAIFLRTVGHQHKHRVLGDRFQHSLNTINHAIHDVLRALLTLSPLYITPPDFFNTPQRVVNSHDFYPYFKASSMSTRYHLQEYRAAGVHPTTPQELFNLRHSQLRNVVERCFGVLKMRFPVLRYGMSCYSIKTQVDMVIACCVIHNFIRRFGMADMCFDQNVDGVNADPTMHSVARNATRQTIEAQTELRTAIADAMWQNMNTI
ncbi:hypothetical protein ACS0TY_034174 [Phlomoides rotata]